MIKTWVADPRHAELIHPKEFYKADKHWRQRLKAAIKDCPALVFSAPDGVIAIVGATEIHEHGVELWAVISESVFDHKLGFAREAYEVLETYARVNKLKRIQVVVPVLQKSALRFAKFLKFVEEGTLKQYGPEGDDYVILGRIF